MDMNTTPQAAQAMNREDYKAIKHMNKDQLTQYLARVYRRGFEAGYNTAATGTAHKAE